MKSCCGNWVDKSMHIAVHPANNKDDDEEDSEDDDDDDHDYEDEDDDGEYDDDDDNNMASNPMYILSSKASHYWTSFVNLFSRPS